MLTGFGNHHESEAIAGALPIGQNSPQICPFKLYAEQINGTSFTQPRHLNLRSWLYRLKPSVGHEDFQPYPKNDKLSTDNLVYIPNQMRWSPFALLGDAKTNFVDGLALVASAGSPSMRHGLNIHVYAFNSEMVDESIYNSDGDFLIVPQMGDLNVKTEFGLLQVKVNEICVIPRGIVFQINRCETSSGSARGYILEVFSGHFELPDLGPIGANGLANPQDFQYPVAAFDSSQDSEKPWRVFNKFNNQLFVAKRADSPFNVVAWRGNYAPYKYDLGRFNTINSVSWDHPDPSIFTVLTCKSSASAGPVADFVIFPPRWQVSEHTFRPPYFHRNAMTEFMGRRFSARRSFTSLFNDSSRPGFDHLQICHR